MPRIRALCLLIVLSACGRVDSQATFFPEALRQPAPHAAAPEPEPDATRLVRDNLTRIFLENSAPTNVRMSALRRNASGHGWTACIKATITTVGKATRAVTYVIPFERGDIGMRRVATPEDVCESEQYARL